MMKTAGYILLMLTMLLLAVGCADTDNSGQGTPDFEDSEDLFVTRQSVRMADGIETNQGNDSDPIIVDGFNNGDLLYFSQMPQGKTPNFTNNTEAKNPMLVYQYSANPAASWTDGYNFKVKEEGEGFTWANVIEVGPSGNAYKFFAFHFPVDQKPVWSVQADQTGGQDNPYDRSNFLRSDILGAYHATSAVYTRMRFRLFHLMTYLKVTVYVPVVKEYTDEKSNTVYTGFGENAMVGGYVMNAITNFGIEWAAAKSSDTEAPLVQTTASSQKTNIKMYRHKSNEEATEEISVGTYYGGDVEGITDGKDEVRAYTFSVLFPTQTFGENFLCFALKTPGSTEGNTDYKYYYFSASQLKFQEGNTEESFGLTQGTLQQLFLYLPRKTNQSVLIGAQILPWKESVTDMTVNKQNNE